MEIVGKGVHAVMTYLRAYAPTHSLAPEERERERGRKRASECESECFQDSERHSENERRGLSGRPECVHAPGLRSKQAKLRSQVGTKICHHILVQDMP